MPGPQVMKSNEAEVDTGRLLTGAGIDPDNFWKGELEIFRVQRSDVQKEIIRVYLKNENALQRTALPMEQPILMQQSIKEVLAVTPSDTGVSLRSRSKRTVAESTSEPVRMSKRLRNRKSQPENGTPKEEKVILQVNASLNSNRDVFQSDLKGSPPVARIRNKASAVSSSQSGGSQFLSRDSLSVLEIASLPPKATQTVTLSEPGDCHSPQQDNMPKVSMVSSPSEGHMDASERSMALSPPEGIQNAVGTAMPVTHQAEHGFGGVQNTESPFPTMRGLIDYHSGSPHHEPSAYFPTSYERTRIGLPISQGGNLADELSPMDRGCRDKDGNFIQPLPHPDPLSGFVSTESSVPPADDTHRMKAFIDGMTEAMIDAMDNTKITGWFTHTYSSEDLTLAVEIVDSKGNIERQTLPIKTILERLSPKDAKGLRRDLIKAAMARIRKSEIVLARARKADDGKAQS